MQIRWVGSKLVRRIAGAYEWSRKVGFVQDVVEADLAAELLTEPDGCFVVNEVEPLLSLKGVGEQRVAELALAGIATLDDLAALDADGVERLAALINGSSQQVRAWRRRAQGILNNSETEDREEEQ